MNTKDGGPVRLGRAPGDVAHLGYGAAIEGGGGAIGIYFCDGCVAYFVGDRLQDLSGRWIFNGPGRAADFELVSHPETGLAANIDDQSIAADVCHQA